MIDYTGRYKDGTPEQLKRAEEQLNAYINRAKNAIKSADYMTGRTKEEHLAHHENSLAHLQAQLEELHREIAKRKENENHVKN